MKTDSCTQRLPNRLALHVAGNEDVPAKLVQVVAAHGDNSNAPTVAPEEWSQSVSRAPNMRDAWVQPRRGFIVGESGGVG